MHKNNLVFVLKVVNLKTSDFAPDNDLDNLLI